MGHCLLVAFLGIAFTFALLLLLSVLACLVVMLVETLKMAWRMRFPIKKRWRQD